MIYQSRKNAKKNYMYNDTWIKVMEQINQEIHKMYN